MILKTIVRDKDEKGKGIFYDASQELEEVCEITFGLYLPQCEVADVRKISIGYDTISPKFVQYIEQNPNNIIGIMVDVEVEEADNTRSLRLMNELILGVAELNHKNVHITAVIGL